MFSFNIPNIDDNEDGWGPSNIPEKFKNVPYYTSYNKGDKLGKSADWQQQQNKYNRYQQKEKEGAVNTIFNFYYQEDDSTFQLVDNARVQPKRFTRRFQNRSYQQTARNQTWTQQSKQQKPRNQKFNKLGSSLQWNRSRYPEQQAKKRESSVEVKADWKLVEEIEHLKLGKFILDTEPQPEELKQCGNLGYYNQSYDLISSRTEKTLERTSKTFFNVTTSDDPIIRQFSMDGPGTVFATDSILAHLMACPRSGNSWDILVTKVGSKLFFDKRDNSSFDLLSVNETSIDPPTDDPKESINSASSLSKEATFVNQSFSQQVLLKGEVFSFQSPNPFQSEIEGAALVGYKYRKWTISEGIVLIARCEIDGVAKTKGRDSFLTIKALNEFDPKSDWRKKIDSQRGAVLATELKNNAHKLAKWTAQSLLTGTDSIKLGYATRVSQKDAFNHVILATQDYKPKEFATQINLNVKNMWGILKNVIEMCMKQPTGKYVLMKDPNKSSMKLYSIPQEGFDGAPSEEKKQIS